MRYEATLCSDCSEPVLKIDSYYCRVELRVNQATASSFMLEEDQAERSSYL